MSAQRRRYFPSFDRLEDRWVPAGNVTASISGNELFIAGDDTAHSISLVGSSTGTTTLSSVDGTTTINGASTPQTFSGFDSVHIVLGAGNDSISISTLTLPGTLAIKLGDGTNALSIDHFHAGRDSVIHGLTGNETISIDLSSFNKALYLTGGTGNDSVTMTDSYFGRKSQINGGLGNDTVAASHDNFGSKVDIFGFETRLHGSTPFAANDSATVNQGSSVTINVASNDVALSGTLDLTSIVITQQPSSGTVVVNNDGTVKYTQNGSAVTSDSFQYTIKNSGGTTSNAATVNLTINPVNQPPVANNDTATVVPGGTVNISVFANDTDPENQLDFTSIAFVQQPAHGTVSLNTDGTVKYTNDGSSSTTDSFQYTVKDLAGNVSNVATVTITINPIVANNDTASVTVGGNTIINVAANDTDTTGTLDLTSIAITQQPTSGTLVVHNDGTVTYTQNGNQATSDTFKYTIKDNNGNTSNVATATITITAAPTGPVANNDTATVTQGGNTIISVASNDTDSSSTLNLASISITQQPLHGSVVVNSDGTVTYTHDNSQTTSDSFLYTIKDNAGATSNAATVTITVTPSNIPPFASNDTATIAQGGTKVIHVAANDTDSDGTLNLNSIVIKQQPQFGTVTVNSDGTVTYVHNGVNALTDGFTYTINDNKGATSNIATVTISVVTGDIPPVAADDLASLAAGTSTVINVAQNDTDADGTIDPATIVITQQPSNGTVVVNTDGTVTYTHNGSVTTSDTFKYTIRDNLGLTSNIATVTLTIT